MNTFLTILSIIVEAISSALIVNVSVRIMSKETYNKNFFKITCSAIFLFLILFMNNLITIYMPELIWCKSIIFIVLGTITIIFIYKVSIFKGLCATIINAVISAFINIIIALIANKFGIDSRKLVEVPSYRSTILIAIGIVEMSFSIISYLVFTTLNKKLSFSPSTIKYIIPQICALIVCMLPSMFLLMLNDFKYSAIFIIVNFLQLITISIVGLFNSKNGIIYETTQLQLDNTIHHNQTLLKVNEGVRGFKHDMTNIVQAILGYVACKDLQGVKDYCENLVVGFNDINILSILSPTVIDNPAIYGVIANKILLARDKNMTLSLDVNLRVNEINFPKFELSRTLGILLDNAIEAGEQTKDKKLILNMRCSEDDIMDIITISNSIKDINIDVSAMFEKNYSTKENPSGFGLYEVSKFFKKYTQGNITASIDRKNKLLTQTITIKHKQQLKQLSIDDLIKEA